MSEGVLEAVLWDLDGVIADTAEYHYQAWQHVLGKRGVALSRTEFMNLFGQRHDTIIRYALGEGLAPQEISTISAEKQDDFRRRVKDNVRPMPGALRLLHALKEHGIKSAIASSAVRENINLILHRLGIEDCFAAVVEGMEVDESKPSPQIFLLAARKLKVIPENCLVIEDAIAGVAAAKRAGMKCIAVTTSHPEEALREADLIVPTLERLEIEDLKRLFVRPTA